jgi:hypothetical protein
MERTDETKSGKESTLPANVHNFQPVAGADFSLHPVEVILHGLF